MVASNINIYLVNAYLSSRYVGLPLGRQLKIFIPIMALCIGCLAIGPASMVWMRLHWAIAFILFLSCYVAISVGIGMKAVDDIRALTDRVVHKNQPHSDMI